MKLAGFQKEFLEESLATGISTAVMPTPSGNGKSTFGGAIGVTATFMDDDEGEPQVPIIATTIGQAIRSVYGVAASMVKNEPELANRSVTFTGIATPRIWVPRNEGLLFPISNEIDGIQGLDPSLALCDELGFQPVAVWSSMLARDGKRDVSLIMGMGTPGFDRENALWAILRPSGKVARRPRWRGASTPADDGCVIDSFTYRRAEGVQDGVPWVAETAFGWLGDRAEAARQFVAGVNWSPGIINPFRQLGSYGRSLDSILEQQRARHAEPVVLVLHLACARVDYLDRGKSAVVIGGRDAA
jgi:Phage terminase-like protein, large subunit